VKFIHRKKETRLSVERHFVAEVGVITNAINRSWRCRVNGERGAAEVRGLMNGAEDGTRKHVAAEVMGSEQRCRPAL